MAELGNRFDCQPELPVSAPVTLDMDGARSEVYGRLKELASFNHEARRGFLSALVTWDELRRILAADLLKGSASEKPAAAGCSGERSRRYPPATVRSRFGSTPASTRASCWRPAGASEWSSASRGTDRGDVDAAVRPAEREVVAAEEVSRDRRSLIHLPLRETAANQAWQAATVVAHNLTAMLAVDGSAGNRNRLHERVAGAVDEDDLRHQAPERVQSRNLQLVRRWLINVPARVVHRARQVLVRLSGGMLWSGVFKRTCVRLTC